MAETILQEIVRVRRERLKRLGPAEGAAVPRVRKTQPPQAFGVPPFLICEIKRRSPSKGNINNALDPLEQAQVYLNRGADHISVLTEPDYFGGSLEDLMAVREAYPRARILRKDFLLNRDDVDVTYRAGADAFLLIASVLDDRSLEDLYRYGVGLGMTPLVELHSPEEATRVRSFAPTLIGVNCRNLKDFTIDPLGPLKLRPHIDWDCRVVYESGVRSIEDARFALGAGLDGLLVGEGVVKDESLVSGLIDEFRHRDNYVGIHRFWRELAPRLAAAVRTERPLVKICGVTRPEDAVRAAELGADMIGFILADSPRKIDPNRLGDFRFLKDFRRGDVPGGPLRIGVVMDGEEALLRDLLDRDLVDAFQFHGGESPERVKSFPGYKALTVRSGEDLLKVGAYRPRPVLIDAFHRDRSGHKTAVLEDDIIKGGKKNGNLWLAGGLTPENLGAILGRHKPDLIDMASGVESAPGVKDHAKLEAVFKLLHRR